MNLSRTFRLLLILGLVLMNLAACSEDPTAVPTAALAADPNALTIASSPEMAPLLSQLADQFNASAKGKNWFVPVKVAALSPSDMVTSALKADPGFQAINPDSSLWLSKLSNEWGIAFASETAGSDALPIPRQRYSLPQRFAASPVVIAMWEKTAQSMGWPGKALGWSDLQKRAAQDANFKWNHPSPAFASGLLSILAEFYVGAGVNRGLTEALATKDTTLEYVKKVESTVRFYGEGESAILERLKKDGTSLLDAFICQEQIVLRWNKENPGQKLVAIYPVEGTLWADHPLALLERYTDFDSTPLSSAQRDTYYEFTRYLLLESAQKQILAGGYRPVNTNIDLQAAGSPFKGNTSVDALQPKTTLQIPPYSVIQVIENVQAYFKKPANVMLVVDTSGSMSDSSKLPKAQTALISFINNIRGKNDKLGVVDFSDRIKLNSGLKPVTQENKDELNASVRKMSPSGNTAIYDGVLTAFEVLQASGSADAINAIVVMTDGKENASKRTNLAKLKAALTSAKIPVVIFSISFGKDADTSDMKALAEATKGQFRQAETINIEELYKIISTYF